MIKTLLMFTWTDVRDALETVAATSQQRRAAWVGAPGGDQQFGHAPWGGTAPASAGAPEPARRLVWVAVIAAGLALTAGSLIGAYDLMSGLEHIRYVTFRPAAGV